MLRLRFTTKSFNLICVRHTRGLSLLARNGISRFVNVVTPPSSRPETEPTWGSRENLKCPLDYLGDLQVWVGQSALDWQWPPHRLPLSTAVLNSAILRSVTTRSRWNRAEPNFCRSRMVSENTWQLSNSSNCLQSIQTFRWEIGTKLSVFLTQIFIRH